MANSTAAVPDTGTAPLALSVIEVCGIVGLSRPSVYAEINSGRLKSFQQGSRRLISADSLRAWIRRKERESVLPKTATRRKAMKKAGVL